MRVQAACRTGGSAEVQRQEETVQSRPFQCVRAWRQLPAGKKWWAGNGSQHEAARSAGTQQAGMTAQPAGSRFQVQPQTVCS